MAIIYNVLAMGSQPFCAQELSRGNRENARDIFCMTLTVGIGITVALSVLILLFSERVTRLLGALPWKSEYAPCREYLTGIAIGFPALTAISLLSTGFNLE